MKLLWDDITEEELKHLFYDEELSDGRIAELYWVTKGKVTYKRNKFKISIRNMIHEELMNPNSESSEKLKVASKQRLLKRENVELISKAITCFAFRNGPVEDMHAMGKLLENDMKVLNKYMVNRLASLFTAMADNKWVQLDALLAYYSSLGSHWDKAEPDVKEIDFVLKNSIKNLKRICKQQCFS